MRIFYLVISFFVFTFSINAQDECQNSIKGTIENNHSHESISDAKVNLIYKGEVKETVYSDASGSFSFSNLECDARYRVSCVKENFAKSVKLIFTVSDSNKVHEINVSFIPIKEFVKSGDQKKIVANNITFYPDSYDLTPEAVVELNNVKKILKKYKNLNIEIVFHTDSRGGAKFLKDLSQKRADACLSFLSAKGIDSSRITAIGYGDTKLLNKCKKGVNCTNKEHLMNRRSEFIVVSNNK